MTVGIYMIRNKINGKIYIGQSNSIEQRLKSHQYELNKNKHANKHLNRAWNKYGENNFEFKIIEECDVNILDDKERYYIKKFDAFNNGYNQTVGGRALRGKDHPFYNGKHSEELKQQMRLHREQDKNCTQYVEIRKYQDLDSATKCRYKYLKDGVYGNGCLRSSQHIENIIAWAKQNNYPLTVRENPSQYNNFYEENEIQRNYSLTEETKHKISKQNKGKKHPNYKQDHKTKYYEIRKIADNRIQQGFSYVYLKILKHGQDKRLKRNTNFDKLVQWAISNNMPLTLREDIYG